MSYSLKQDLDHVLQHTSEVWEALRNQRIFLTGGTGFVGTWLVESLVRANERLDLNASAVLLTRNREGFRRKAPHLAKHPSISFVEGDALSFEFPEGEFPFVIHGATEQHASATAQDPTGTFERDVMGTRHTLEFARTHGATRFLFTSSGAIYGRQPSEMERIPEEYAGGPETVDPNSAYGQAKRASEFMCAMYGRQFGYAAVIARLFVFSGPYLPLDLNFAIGNFVRDALSGGPIKIGGDGTPYRSYLYAADMAIWLWTLLIKGEPARPYNVGSGEGLTIAELAHAVAEHTRPGTKVEIAREPVSGVPAARYVPSVERARQELGLEALIPLSEQIRRMYAWHRALGSSGSS